MRLIPVAALFLMLLIGCERYEASEDERLDMNSFTREWTGPYGGVPNFTDLNLNDLKSALIMGRDQTRSEIYEIANQSENPTFENTILALEETGRLLDRVFSYYGVLSSNLSTPEFRTIQESMAPKISQFYAEINHDNKIFKRIEHLFTNKELLALDKEQERLLTLKYKNLVRNGAALSDSQKRRYQNINIRLSELHTKFSNNVLSEEENYFVIIDSSNLSPPALTDVALTTPPNDNTATSDVPPPISTTIDPVGSATGNPAPIAAATGSSIKYTLRAPAASADSLIALLSTFVAPVGTQITI